MVVLQHVLYKVNPIQRCAQLLLVLLLLLLQVYPQAA